MSQWKDLIDDLIKKTTNVDPTWGIILSPEDCAVLRYILGKEKMIRK